MYGSFCLISEVGILLGEQKHFNRAQALAEKLRIPFCGPTPAEGISFYLRVGEELSLELLVEGDLISFFIDYGSGRVHTRRTSGKQILLKAIGGAGKKVLDATAGLGRDAFVLASLGCLVTALEKSAVLGELVMDGLKRCEEDENLKRISSRLKFIVGESSDYIDKSEVDDFDVLYIDPMYPKNQKSAKPKKEMMILQEFFKSEPGEEFGARQILDKGIKKVKRVVVKRPLNGPELVSGVNFKFKGTTTRFDVYVKEN